MSSGMSRSGITIMKIKVLRSRETSSSSLRNTVKMALCTTVLPFCVDDRKERTIEGVRTPGLPHLVDRAAEAQAALGDHHHRVADARDLVEVVGGQEHGLALVAAAL